MKIIYNPNPLWADIILDDFDKKELWYKIKIYQLIEVIGDAHFELFDTSRNQVDYEYMDSLLEPSKYEKFDDTGPCYLDKRVDDIFKDYLTYLDDYHTGDCTSHSGSCMRCLVEERLGINTIQGLENGCGNYLYSAFIKDGKMQKDMPIRDAIEYLQKPIPEHDDMPLEVQQSWEKSGGKVLYDKKRPYWIMKKSRALDYLIQHEQKICQK